MRRAGLAIAVAALVAAPSGAAHVTTRPSVLVQGQRTTLTFDAPNEGETPMTSFFVGRPDGVEVLDTAGPPGWSGRTIGPAGGVVLWRGGGLHAGRTASFSVTVRTSVAPGTLRFEVGQGYRDTPAVRWQVPITVVPSSPPSQHLGRALVAGVAGVALVTASVLVVHRLRRRPLQDG